MTAYLSQTDLENALSVPTVAVLFVNATSGVDTTALASVLQRASDWCDSYLSTIYRGTFPLSAPIPAMVKEAALTMAIGLSYDRKPEFARQTLGDVRRDWRKEAKEMLKDFAEGKQVIVETVPAKGATISGGIVFDEGPRLLVTSADGTSNTGDF